MTHEELREKIAQWFANKEHPDKVQGEPCAQCYAMADGILALFEPMMAEVKALAKEMQVDCPWCARDGRGPRKLELQLVCDHCGYKGPGEG